MEAYSDADALLAKAGDFGPYQWLLMALFSLVNVASSFHYFSQTFISIAPEHWCNASEFRHLRVLDETTAAKIRHYLRKLPDRGCYRYDWSPEEEPSYPNLPEDGYPPVVPCDRGWIYDRDSGFETAVSELDWVCEDDWKPAAGQSAFFAGSIVGSLVLGFLSDRKGRLPALCAANFMAFAGSVATAFTTTLPSFALSRFISGTATDCNFVMMYIIVMEYVRPEMRTFGLNLCIGVFYCLGCVTVPLIAVALGSWRLFLLVTSAPLAVVVCYYYVVPESALWLTSGGRVAEAADCYARIAQFNGRRISAGTLEAFVEKAAAERSRSKCRAPSLLGLFATPKLRRNSCILVFKSMVLTLCYDAISRNVSGTGYSPFAVFAVGSVTILPSCLVVLTLQDRIGRKATAFSSLVATGIFTAAAGAVLALQTEEDAVSGAALALCAMGRLCVTVAYNSGAQYAAELIPTEVRGQGVAAVHLAGYAAAFFSSYLLYLGKISSALPPLILGPLAAACGFLCLLLPETLNRRLPDTLADGESFGEGERPCDFACCLGAGESSLELRPNRT